MRYYAGLDIGSVSTKAVVIADGCVKAAELMPSGGNYRDSAQRVMERVLSKSGIDGMAHLSGIGKTGLGAEGSTITGAVFSDISCQTMGCHVMFPGAKTVIDIGGQFTKAARITPRGAVADFLISEKCATGSGRFLQIIARILRISLDDVGPLSLTAESPVEFSTNCAVFAESETVSRIAEGAKAADILAGVHRSMASKVAMLVRRLKLEPDVVLTGGGGEDEGLVQAIGETLDLPIFVPERPRLTAAYGAACLAERQGWQQEVVL